MGVIGEWLGQGLGSLVDRTFAPLVGNPNSQGEVGGNVGRALGSWLPFEKGGKVSKTKPKKAGRSKKNKKKNGKK